MALSDSTDVTIYLYADKEVDNIEKGLKTIKNVIGIIGLVAGGGGGLTFSDDKFSSIIVLLVVDNKTKEFIWHDAYTGRIDIEDPDVVESHLKSMIKKL